jgi:hypothetical protein
MNEPGTGWQRKFTNTTKTFGLVGISCTINSVSEQDWAEISLSFVIALGHTKTARLGFGSLHSGYVSGREYSVHWSRSRLKGGCRQDCLPHSRLAFIAPDHCGY